MAKATKKTVPAIKVHQWAKGWDKVDFSAKYHRRKPEPFFFVSTLSAVELRSLCGINRRQAADLTPRAADLGIQRQHDPERSEEIGRFVEFGYPWSTLSEAKRRSEEFYDLRKPGWLPTAIVVNILLPGETRQGVAAHKDDLVTIAEDAGISRLTLPYPKWEKGWKPKGAPPLEVIDGQHRLWAFDENSDQNFEVPIVAFRGLDISWQAYLFWTINIKPKRINVSLAYDLYPLLRGEDWLDRAEGHPIYRETRSQELTEALWSNTESPWYDRINMLGERQVRWPSQAGWIRSLMATFIRPWHGRGGKIGGLFGSRVTDEDEVLGWSRAQQAAFLIEAWATFKAEVARSKARWCSDLRSSGGAERGDDAAFYGPYSLIPTDQGIRGFLHVLNDLHFYMAPRWKPNLWRFGEAAKAGDEGAVSAALASLRTHDVRGHLVDVAKALVAFDWRAASAPSLDQDERRGKMIFRGSGGYAELRTQLMQHIARQKGELGTAADRILGEAS